MTARCGSQSTILAPMPISLSTKNSRDSNIFSNTSSMPAHCVALTIVVDITSAGNAGQGPSSSFGHVAAEVGTDAALLVGRPP